MAMFPDPFDALLGLQRALDTFRSSDWLASGPGGGYPPLNVFRKGEDYVVIAEVPGVRKRDLDIQVKNDTVRISGSKSVEYGEKASLHRRERPTGRFDRTITLPIRVDPDSVQAECRDGVLALLLPPLERDRPRRIKLA